MTQRKAPEWDETYQGLFEAIGDGIVDAVFEVTGEEPESPDLRDTVQDVLTTILANYIVNTTKDEFTAHFRLRMAQDALKTRIGEAIRHGHLGPAEDTLD